jgi:hypothetical protein
MKEIVSELIRIIDSRYVQPVIDFFVTRVVAIRVPRLCSSAC